MKKLLLSSLLAVFAFANIKAETITIDNSVNCMIQIDIGYVNGTGLSTYGEYGPNPITIPDNAGVARVYVSIMSNECGGFPSYAAKWVNTGNAYRNITLAYCDEKHQHPCASLVEVPNK